MYWDYNYVNQTIRQRIDLGLTRWDLPVIEPYSGGLVPASKVVTEIPPTVNLFPPPDGFGYVPPPTIYDESKWYEKREVLIGGIALAVLIFGAILIPKGK